MIKKFSIFLLVFTFLSCNCIAVFSQSSFTVKILKSAYSYGEKIIVSGTAPLSGDDFAIEILKGDTSLSYLPLTTIKNSLNYDCEILVSSLWKNGDDYTVRVGKGEDYAEASFVIGDAVKSVSITNKDSFLSVLTTTSALQLSYLVAPVDAIETGVIFSSSDTRVATVSEIGLVNFIGVGNVTITVSSKNEKSDYVKFDVSNPVSPTNNRPSSGGGGRVIAKTQAPISNSVSGPVEIGTKIELFSENGSLIYYTLDGSTPTKNSTLYKDGIIINSDTTIKAIAIVKLKNDSNVTEFNYIIKQNKDVSFKEDISKIRYIVGYSGNLFMPDSMINRYEVLECLNKIVDIKNDNNAIILSDVEDSFKNIVDLFCAGGVISGYPDNTFRGNNGLTRAEFIKIISVILGINNFKAENLFTDIEFHWAKDYINEFLKKGYIKGYSDKTFRPDQMLTRAEFTVIVNRIINISTEANQSGYSDLNSDHWAYYDVLRACQK